MNISKSECYYLGYVSKAQGFKGGVISFLDVDNPTQYKKLGRVLVDMNGILTPFFLESINLKDKGFAHMKFEGVNSKDDASNITGKELYLPLTDLPKLPENEYYLHDLVGMTVEDASAGELGKVDSVLDFSRNPLIQVVKGGEEVLIPISKPFLVKVDKAAKRIHVDLPEGLIEVNRS